MKSFRELMLPSVIEKALVALSFETPTPIQAEAIPLALAGKDVLGSAQTGTGKTAAFCIPILVRLLQNPGRISLVLVPTRELATQIAAFWKELTRFAPHMNYAVLIGGMPMPSQVRTLKHHPRLIVATPGRLIDHLMQRTLSISQTEILVLDEADRMLDMGFEPQLTQVLKYLPKYRQTLLFSATMPPAMEEVATRFLTDPVRVSVGSVSQAAPLVNQNALLTIASKKNETLLAEIGKRAGSILVFARTQNRTDKVARYLQSKGLEVNCLHGGRSQGQRNSALKGFSTGKVRILVATDLAARGIDVADIAHVINYDLPLVAEDYIHRIGRTARAGASGQATSFVTPEDKPLWAEITRLLQQTGSQVPVPHPFTQ